MPAIDLDHNATTRPHPSVRAAMAAALDDTFGNPSSVHAAGRAARDLVERARAEVAALVGASPEEIVYCSGGTEGDNLAIRGAAHAMRRRTGRDLVISSPLEHPAVHASLAALAREGFRVAMVEVGPEGAIDPADVARLADGAALVTLAAANHEIGNRYDLAALAEAAHRGGAVFHTDAVQAAGRIALDLTGAGVDLATLSAHKLYGPKGIGAIVQRRGVEVDPLVEGGHQERGRRPGTENVPGIAGFGAACALARRQLSSWTPRIERLRARLEAGALAIEGARRFGSLVRVPGTANLGFRGVDGELLMASLDLEGIAVSTGAACTSGSIDPSAVILALGVPRAEAKQAVRFSLGWENSDEEIDRVLHLLPPIIARIRAAG